MSPPPMHDNVDSQRSPALIEPGSGWARVSAPPRTLLPTGQGVFLDDVGSRRPVAHVTLSMFAPPYGLTAREAADVTVDKVLRLQLLRSMDDRALSELLLRGFVDADYPGVTLDVLLAPWPDTLEEGDVLLIGYEPERALTTFVGTRGHVVDVAGAAAMRATFGLFLAHPRQPGLAAALVSRYAAT